MSQFASYDVADGAQKRSRSKKLSRPLVPKGKKQPKKKRKKY